VLKQRYLPPPDPSSDTDAYAAYRIHDDSEFDQSSGTTCWPKAHVKKGFFESGKEFRHEQRVVWAKANRENFAMRLLTVGPGGGMSANSFSTGQDLSRCLTAQSEEGVKPESESVAKPSTQEAAPNGLSCGMPEDVEFWQL
jgi:hypothetical protein